MLAEIKIKTYLAVFAGKKNSFHVALIGCSIAVAKHEDHKK
jgi:hypothetical protein